MPDTVFPYPGGKSRMADDIIDRMADHDCYVEPFGGTAAVLLQKPESDVEVYNDVSGGLVNFFEVVRDDTEALAEWLQSTPYSRKLHERYISRLYGDGDPPDDVEWAGMYYYIQRSTFAGKTHHKNTGELNAIFKPPQLDGDSWRDFGGEYKKSIERIKPISERLKGVTIECKNWSYVVDRYDSPTTLFYFDPPYVESEGYYGTDFDHDDFADRLQTIEGRFVLSYGDDVPAGLSDYHIHTDTIQRSIGNEDADGDTMAERIITNYDPADVDPFAGAGQTGVDQFL